MLSEIVTISSQSGPYGVAILMPRPRKKKMSLSRHEQQRARARAANLSRHYGSIGPAAIIAALMFRPQGKRSAL